MLMEASWPSNRLAAVTNRSGLVVTCFSLGRASVVIA
jgi:hypothetical protein